MLKIFIASIFIVNINLAQGFICAVGGGSEDYNSWSDKPYSWIVEKSDSGKIIIISNGPSSDPNWLPNYFKSLGAKEVYNKYITSRSSADLQTTYDELITAKAIFIKGGDQWQYNNLWNNTKTEDAIRQVYYNGGVIAGTSAGAMILSDVAYIATQNSTIDSKGALQNPFSPIIQLEDHFLDLIPNTLVDTHFIERGRFARLAIFIFNYYINNNRAVIGIGIDDQTALCIEPDGIAEVMGSGAVSFYQIDDKTRMEYLSSEFIIENLKCDMLVENWKYNINEKSICYVPPTAQEFDVESEIEFPKTDIWLSGGNSIQSAVNNHLSLFINEADVSNVVLLFNQGFENNIAELENFLYSRSINFSKIALTESILNDIIEKEKIDYSTSIIICGDNLSTLSLIADTSKFIGQAFNSAVNRKVDMYCIGNSGKVLCGTFINNVDNQSNASYYGSMITNLGTGVFADLAFQPMLFNDNDYYENRISSLFLGLKNGKRKIGLWLDENDFCAINEANSTITSFGPMPIMIVNASNTTFVDSSNWKMRSGAKTRQSVAMNNLRITISSSDLARSYSIADGVLIHHDDFNEDEIISSHYLYQNFPNPFNPNTVITYQINNTAYVSLKLYDILGREVADLVEDIKTAGHYFVQVSANDFHLSSGVYFYKLVVMDNTINIKYQETKKMVLLK